MPTSDPFATRYDVPVAGGSLHVARSGPPASDADGVVLAAHGITASHLAWRAVARELAGDARVCLLAPDLRGRGHSAHLPGPYGIAAHVADLLAVLDEAGVTRAVLVGHSMGGYVVPRLAAERPDRVAAVVLLDGGVPLALPADEDPETVLEKVVGPAVARLHMTFASREEYVAQWRSHPALVDAWNDDVELYAGYDVMGEPGAMRCVVSEDAVRADSADLLSEEAARAALHRTRAPVHLLRARRGFRNEDDKPFISDDALKAFAADHRDVDVEDVAGVNHYTLTLGESPGPSRVAGAIRSALREARTMPQRA
ncbi:MAG: lipase [Solirubrobacteraceae bacterium]|nr:lipase [Solirubrobacteraceae bacterium]